MIVMVLVSSQSTHLWMGVETFLISTVGLTGEDMRPTIEIMLGTTYRVKILLGTEGVRQQHKLEGP